MPPHILTDHKEVTDSSKDCVEDDTTQVVHEDLVVKRKRRF